MRAMGEGACKEFGVGIVDQLTALKSALTDLKKPSLTRKHHFFHDFTRKPINAFLSMILVAIDVYDRELMGCLAGNRYRQSSIRVNRA